MELELKLQKKKEELKLLVKNRIEECITNVSNGKFEIRPVKIEKLVDGCNFCPYKDICFKSTKRL